MLASARAVRRIRHLGYDAFEFHVSRAYIEVGAVLEVLAVEDALRAALRQHGLQHALSLKQRRRSRVKTIEVQKIERVIHQAIVASALEIVLQCAEIWAAVLTCANDLAVQDELAGRKARHARNDGREAARPVKSAAYIKPHAAIAYMCLDSIAVQLEFMDQAACGRDLGPWQGEARQGWMKAGKGARVAPGSARADERDEERRGDDTNIGNSG